MLPSLQKPFRATDLRKRLVREPVGRALAEPRAAERAPANGCTVSLEEALERNWLEVWYQAKIDLKSMTICGAEALVRARHPERGVVAPADFLPTAGDPLYQPLSSFVLRRAMADWPIFADHGAALKLSVNSPVSVLQAPGFIGLIRRVLPEDGRFPALILEVTEDEIISDLGWMHEIATQLRLYNVSLSIDDFGSAYASLARLRDLPFVEIKLDRSFVANCADNPLNRGVCATVVDLAHRFQASLCAEGVETEEDLPLSHGHGLRHGAGISVRQADAARRVPAVALRPADQFRAPARRGAETRGEGLTRRGPDAPAVQIPIGRWALCSPACPRSRAAASSPEARARMSRNPCARCRSSRRSCAPRSTTCRRASCYSTRPGASSCAIGNISTCTGSLPIRSGQAARLPS